MKLCFTVSCYCDQGAQFFTCVKSVNIVSVLKSWNALTFTVWSWEQLHFRAKFLLHRNDFVPENCFCAAVFHSNCLLSTMLLLSTVLSQKKWNSVKYRNRCPPQQNLLNFVNSILFAQSSHTSCWLSQVVTMLRSQTPFSDTTDCSAYQALTKRLCSDCISSFCVLIPKRDCTFQTSRTNRKWERECVCFSMTVRASEAIIYVNFYWLLYEMVNFCSRGRSFIIGHTDMGLTLFNVMY